MRMIQNNNMKPLKLSKENILSILRIHSVKEIILRLSHGQATVERNFSFGKSFATDNSSKVSILNKK